MSISIQNRLYVLQTLHIILIAIVTKISITVTLKTWSQKLRHSSYSYFNCFQNVRGINMSKLEVN